MDSFYPKRHKKNQRLPRKQALIFKEFFYLRNEFFNFSLKQ